MTYRAPVRDLAFALNDIVGIERLAPGFPDLDRDTVAAVLEAAGQFSTEVLAPLNSPGDQQGARYANGVVTTPSGFREAYRQFAADGWNSLDAPVEHGGQGLPKALALAVFETVHAANMAFGLCPLLTHGAIEALAAHGSERQKALYLPRMISGEWTGTMNLTEPQAGSDLSQLRARAEPDGEGGFRLTGQKIFITWGDHDCADNIVHLVLARLPDAPEGVRGISLFVAPKRLVGDDGAPGEPNALRPGGIEHKLGIHASPTCTMLFEGARAELVGQPGQGLAAMFTMMNSARLNVGMEGVGIAERAYQGALAYALERRQGRSAWTGESNARIFDHPDVRRSLMLMKGEGSLVGALCLDTAVNADLARVADTAEAREAARLREELFVPVAKAWSTDMGVEVASMGVQIHGGMGFVEETGAAQHYRDARIAPIYEGTNAIQAIDLMGRKLGLQNGAAVRALIADVRATAAELGGHTDEWLHAPGERLRIGADAVETATDWLIERKGHAQPDALSGATPYLTLMGDVIGGWFLARGALAALRGSDWSFARTRVGLLRVYADQVLARAPGWCAATTAGAVDLYLATPEALGAH
jgi:alkylation response protein AidB-like acyl-CoA dehydrogenase